MMGLAEIEVGTGVGGFFCAAHKDKETGDLHGHTWEVEAWFPKGNAKKLKKKLDKVLLQFDHKVLPRRFAWGEDLAEEILRLIPKCNAVYLRRNPERIYARAKRMK